MTASSPRPQPYRQSPTQAEVRMAALFYLDHLPVPDRYMPLVRLAMAKADRREAMVIKRYERRRRVA